MPTSPIVQLQMALAVGVILLALWKGGAAERLTGLVVAANLIAGFAADALPPGLGPVASFATDGLTALALLAVTVRWAAPWMGAVMLLYASQFALHAYYEIAARDPRDYLHALINNINFSGVSLCLAAGTVVAWRRRIRARSSPDDAAPSSRAPRR